MQPPRGTSADSSRVEAAPPGTTVAPKDPYILEDGGFQIEPLYWLNRAQPSLNTGLTATALTTLDFTGNANYSVGAEVGVPAGAQNTVRFSYFRVQGNSNATLTQYETIFSEAYGPGDYINTGYRLQDFRLWWDYLSYNWYKKPGTLRLKTLYGVQYTTISSNFYAPFKPVITDANGNTDNNTATGSKNLIYPDLGLELEQELGRHFRWQASVDAFGWPHRSDFWNGEASIAYHVKSFELIAGEKAFHLKTSPMQSEYFTDTLSGPYVAVRYYWGRNE